MQQQWVAFWSSVEDAAHRALWPLRAIAEALGIGASDLRIWLFLCTLFFLAIFIPMTYGDLVLRRRNVLVTGKVVKINKDSDGLDTPTIEFADSTGKVWRFDSTLPVNATTGAVGATVHVMYDPLHPQRAREAGRPLMKAFQTIVSFAIFIGLMIATYVIP